MPARPTLDPLNPVPAGDIMSDAYSKTNDGLSYAIVDVRVESNELVVEANDGYTFNIPMPAGADRVLTGLATSIIGSPGPFSIAWTAGTYQLLGVNHSIAGGSLPITAAHATLNRIDLLVVDAAETAGILEGTPAESPSAPTPAADELVVTIISIPAASAPVVIPPGVWSASNLDPGTSDGQSLRWTQSSSRWTRNNYLTSTPTILNGQASTLVGFGRTGTGSDGASALQMSAAFTNLYHLNGSGTYNVAMKFDTAGQRILIQSTGSTKTVLDVDVDDGIKVKDVTPASTTNRIYNIAGTLYWNGSPLGGAATPRDTVIVNNANYSPDPDTEGEIILYNSGANRTITLPAAPSADAQIRITSDDDADQFVNTISGNGNTINGASAYTIGNGKGSVLLVWDNTSNWVIASETYKTLIVDIVASVDSPYTVPRHRGIIHVSVNTDAASTVNMPASPFDGQEVRIKDRTYDASVNVISVAGNGNDIDANSPQLIDLSGAAMTVFFVETNSNWEIV